MTILRSKIHHPIFVGCREQDRTLGGVLPDQLTSLGSLGTDCIKETIPVAHIYIACHHQGVGLKTSPGFKGPQPLPTEGIYSVQLVVKAPNVYHTILDGWRMT